MKKIKTYLSYFKQFLRVFISRYFAGLIYALEKRRILNLLKNKQELVLVYTIGKVGSSSVYYSLKSSSEFDLPLFHLHFLSDGGISEQVTYYKSSARKSVPFHLIQSRILADFLKTYTGKLYIISLIREPVSRELSSLFQDSFNFSASNKIENEKTIQVVRQYIDSLSVALPEIKWFENEIHNFLGIDIYSKPFDIQKGYQLFENGKCSMCLIRLENLNNCYFQAMTDLFAGKNITFNFENYNEGDNKFYSDFYNTVKKELKIEPAQVEKIISSKFIQVFYPDQVEKIRSKWSSEASVN